MIIVVKVGTRSLDYGSYDPYKRLENLNSISFSMLFSI